MKKLAYAIAVNKLEKIEKGRNKGKYKTVLKHESFIGTWNELEEYLQKMRYTLIGYDYFDITEEVTIK